MQKSRKQTILIATGVVFLLTIAFAGTACYLVFGKQFQLSHSKDLYVDRDDTVDSVYFKIQQIAAPRSMLGIKLLASYFDYKQVHTGKYTVDKNMSSLSLFKKLYKGKQTPTTLKLTYAKTRAQLASRVAKQLMIDSTEISSLLHDSLFCLSKGYTRETIMTLFLPNNYQVYWNMSATDFFDRMTKEHRLFWNKERLHKANLIGLTPIQVSTLASIVDEETNNVPEKAMVAGLYVNRIHKGMLLQADPTVKFGLQEFGLRRLVGAHLKVDSNYNTYLYKGLPPAPIRMPSVSGIEAVLNYEKHDYLFMCAKEDFSGTHNFTTSYADHQINAKRYWKALNERNIH